MSAETLREAARLMRERASVGPDQPWTLDHDDQIVARYTLGEVVIADYVREELAPHIASWHPAVALAVADWLEQEAEAHVHVLGAVPTGLYELPGMDNTPAMRVARAYLGEV